MVIETGLPDFHKMSLTVMKVFYKKQSPNIVRYRSYRNFNNEIFINEVGNNILKKHSRKSNLEFEIFLRMKLIIFLRSMFLLKNVISELIKHPSLISL